jgi:hypothetical protein
MKCSAILGAAGTGKSYRLRQLLDADPDYAILTATTGIAAVNLGEGVTTINSLLGYFDEHSLRKAFNSGKLTAKFAQLGRSGKHSLVIDECSMLNAETLDLIYAAAKQASDLSKSVRPIDLILVGDYVQLPPVQGTYAFKAACWKEFAPNAEVLQEVKRQTDPLFLEVLGMLRRGAGVDAARQLYKLHIPFTSEPDIHFDGTTLFSISASVEKFNRERLAQIDAPTIKLRSSRWGKQRGEWSNIPEITEMKHGAVAMILANDPPDFSYVNGDLAHVIDDCGSIDERNDSWQVRLKLMRNDKEFTLGTVLRSNTQLERPEGKVIGDAPQRKDFNNPDEFSMAVSAYFDEVSMKKWPFYDPFTDEWVVGQIEYVPVRLGYASTFHKCVTLDTIVQERTRGLILVGDVQTGDALWTGRKFSTVIATDESIQPCVKVTTELGFSIKCSREHRFPTRGDGLLEADALEPHHKLGIVFGREHQNDNGVTPDLAYLMGILVGDGSYNDPSEGNIHFCSRDSFLQQRFISICDMYAPTGKANTRADKKGAFVTSKPFRKMLLNFGLEYVTAHSKSIPLGVLQSCNLRHFLRGLMDTDGSVGTSHLIYSTVSTELAQQVHLAFCFYGMSAVLDTFTNNYGPHYQIRIGANGIEQYKERIGFERPYKVAKLERLSPNRIIKRFTGWDSVKTVEQIGMQEVIDIELDEEPNLFWANGIITHNSQGLSLDRVQVDCRQKWAEQPSMIYVAISRCRSLGGLRIVGDVGKLSRRIRTSREVREWV